MNPIASIGSSLKEVTSDSIKGKTCFSMTKLVVACLGCGEASNTTGIKSKLYKFDESSEGPQVNSKTLEYPLCE
jgi:hypothetical protein